MTMKGSKSTSVTATATALGRIANARAALPAVCSLLLLLVVPLQTTTTTTTTVMAAMTISRATTTITAVSHARHRHLQPAAATTTTDERPSFDATFPYGGGGVENDETNENDSNKKNEGDMRKDKGFFSSESSPTTSSRHPSPLTGLTTSTAGISSTTTDDDDEEEDNNKNNNSGKDPDRHHHHEKDDETIVSPTIDATATDTATPSSSSSSSSSSTTTSSNTEQDWMESNKMDILIALFFTLAAIWLILAVVYSSVLLVLLRLQANGELDLYDENLGVLALCGGRVKLRFGWLLRRYAIQLENDHNRRLHRRHQEELMRARATGGEHTIDDINNDDLTSPQPIRIMTREERRKAMEELLSGKKNRCSGIEKDQVELTLTETMSDEGSKNSVPSGSCDDNSDHCDVDYNNNNNNHNKIEDLEKNISPSKSRTPRSQQCSSPGANSCCSDEGPVCSICLGGYEQGATVFRSKTCPHMFHSSCIMDWLERRNHTECPCCRETMVSDDEVWEIVQRNRKERRRQSRQTNSFTTRFIRWILPNNRNPQEEEEQDESPNEQSTQP